MIRTLAALRTEYAAALARPAALLEREAFRSLDLIGAATRLAVLMASNASSLLRLFAIWFGLHNSRNDSAVMTLRGLVQAIGNDAHYRVARLANLPVVARACRGRYLRRRQVQAASLDSRLTRRKLSQDAQLMPAILASQWRGKPR
jgi:hypothetical protein